MAYIRVALQLRCEPEVVAVEKDHSLTGRVADHSVRFDLHLPLCGAAPRVVILLAQRDVKFAKPTGARFYRPVRARYRASANTRWSMDQREKAEA